MHLKFIILPVFLLVFVSLIPAEEEINFQNSVDEFVKQFADVDNTTEGIGCAPVKAIFDGLEAIDLAGISFFKNIGFFDGLGRIWKEEIYNNCRFSLTFKFIKFKLANL